MGTLVIKHKVHKVVRKVIGVLFFIIGILWLIIHINEMNLLHWVYSVVFTGLGIAQFFAAFGSDSSEATAENDFIRIKWVTWLKPRVIQYSEIENLTFTIFDIVIKRKGKKPLKLKLDFLERDQMKEVREFFLKLAAERGLSYENRCRS
jgi:hypothetical protein